MAEGGGGGGGGGIGGDFNEHAKTFFRAYADSERSDQPAHARSLIRPSLSQTESLDTIECFTGSKGPDDNLRCTEMSSPFPPPPPPPPHTHTHTIDVVCLIAMQ